MAFIQVGDYRLWARDEKVEFWVIIHKETKKLIDPRSKFVFESEQNALKSLYYIFSSKAKAEPYLHEFSIIRLAEYEAGEDDK